MVTDRPNLLLGILTADCAPVLFADAEAGVIGAAHAGWRGALAGVTDATIAAMERLGARRERIRAAVGPCIAQPSYEVDEGFRDALPRAGPGQRALLRRRDLRASRTSTSKPMSCTASLAAGIGEVEALNLDTYADPDRFYSYRRATHRGEADYGRQLSAIALPLTRLL